MDAIWWLTIIIIGQLLPGDDGHVPPGANQPGTDHGGAT